MSKLTASLVVDLVDKTGAKAQAIIGNMDRLKRAERDYMLADRGLKLSNRDRAMERLMMEKEADVERRRQQYRQLYGTVATGVVAAGVVAGKALLSYADLERRMTRIGITADASAEQMKEAFSVLQSETKKLAMPLQDGIEALDTLVASGMNLREAMAFMPSVLATAQASGATTIDIANTALKTSSALGIAAGRMQAAFDIMVVGGKAGQFELDSMAQYLPGLANSFASLGYKGEDGLKQLIAVLQTLRGDTGDASAAATQAANIFGKMFSGDTIKKFSEFGIDLRKEMDLAAASGEDAIGAFVRLSKQAINGDLKKLPLLFSDQEFRLGMQSLITSPDSLQRVLDLLNSSNVEGTVFKDVKRIMDDTQSSVDRLKSSFGELFNSMGATVAESGIVEVMDAVTNNLDMGRAIAKGKEKRGQGWIRRNLGPMGFDDPMDLAYEGGYRDPEFLKRYWRRRYGDGSIKSSTGRQNMPVVISEFPDKDSGFTTKNLPTQGPYPSARPDPSDDARRESEQNRRMAGRYPSRGQYGAPQTPDPALDGFMQFHGLVEAGSTASDKIAEGGGKAGKAAAETFQSQAAATGQAIGAAAAQSFLAKVQGSLGALLANAGGGRPTGQVVKEQANGQFVDP